MRIYDNGIYRDMTQEEIKQLEEYSKNNIEVKQEPTLEQRVTELEKITQEQFKIIQQLQLIKE